MPAPQAWGRRLLQPLERREAVVLLQTRRFFGDLRGVRIRRRGPASIGAVRDCARPRSSSLLAGAISQNFEAARLLDRGVTAGLEGDRYGAAFDRPRANFVKHASCPAMTCRNDRWPFHTITPMKNHLSKLLLMTVAAITAATAHSQSVVYTSREAYDLAHPGNYVIIFDNYGPSGTIYPSGITAPTLLGDVAFAPLGEGRRLEIIDATIFGAATSNLVLFALDAEFNQDAMLITLPANTFSFGTDIISPSQTVPAAYQFTLFSGAAELTTLPASSLVGQYTFIGYDSDTDPITSIRVQITGAAGSPGPALDNFTVVPEPSVTCLIAMGAIGALFLLRRAKKCRSTLTT